MKKLTERADRRVLRTRDTLGDALMELILEKPFEEITVQQVLDRARVGRSTFYMHYRDKEDLFLSDVEDFFLKMSGALTNQHASPWRLAPLAEFCEHIRQQSEFLAALRTSEKLEEVFVLGRGIFSRAMERRLSEAKVAGSETYLSARAHALSGAMFALIDWWIDTGMKMTPAQLDATFHEMAWDGLRTRENAGRWIGLPGATDPLGTDTKATNDAKK